VPRRGEGLLQGLFLSAVPVQMGQGSAQSRGRWGRGGPSPGADVAGVGPVSGQMGQGWARSRGRCGRGGPNARQAARPLLWARIEAGDEASGRGSHGRNSLLTEEPQRRRGGHSSRCVVDGGWWMVWVLCCIACVASRVVCCMVCCMLHVACCVLHADSVPLRQSRPAHPEKQSRG
jgi:hypothetical protein